MPVPSSRRPALPAPAPEALAQSQALADAIVAAIRAAGGWIGFDDFMQRALYTPGLGYYTGGSHKFGRLAADGSDFVTAPELSPLYGRTLATPVRAVLKAADSRAVMEFGAGSGALAAELLNALGDDCAEYLIVEVSAELRARQRETVERRAPAHAHKLVWLDALPDRFSGCIVGNEVLDAMPVKLVLWDGEGWRERGVTIGASGFEWEDRPLTAGASAGDAARAEAGDASRTLAPHAADTLALIDASIGASLAEQDGLDWPATPAAERLALYADCLPAPYLTELCPAAEAFAATLARLLDRGAAILIDYGFPAAEFFHPQRAQGTLMCHYRHHAHDDPFFLPGLQDITAHVNFTAVALAAIDAGATHAGYAPQNRFLLDAGIADHIAAAGEPRSAAYLRAASEAHKLLDEHEMGELFKVIAFAHGIDGAIPGFASGDRSHTL
ncbi:class I SAM-dependent methyltransferase [Derxia gummosa]|uniref:Class I SAM-dependent methyltransferase n=1 Tax=Derxia gummosa DSM 723 TaxID=1121388 RepID=A0A8B6X5F2_9BURK|nr:SAM-dependent methyltransferase [Derxia gummosa]